MTGPARCSTVILSGFCLLATATASIAACAIPVSVESGKKEKNIKKILDFWSLLERRAARACRQVVLLC